MLLDDPAWQTWSVESYPPIATPSWPQSYGSNEEPYSSLWCASLADAFEPKFREGVSVLDYGCGGARFANFMSRRLADFRYVGVEPTQSGPLDDVGSTNLQLCQSTYGHDPRVRFGKIGTPFEAAAIAEVDVIVAGSIFTHLQFRDLRAVAQKFLPAMRRGVDFVFDVFFAHEYRLNGAAGLYGVGRCWPWVTYTRAMVDELAAELGVVVVQTGTFRSNLFEHQILHMWLPAELSAPPA